MFPSDWLWAVGFVRDVVAGQEEPERDQQAARGDERDHVADAGEQDLPGARAPADAAGGSRGSGGACTAFHPGRVGVVRGGNGFGDHLVGFVDGAFDAGGDDGLAREPRPVLDADIGGEDDGVGLGDRRRVHGRASRRALRLDMHGDAGVLGGGGQRIGGHVGVRDAGRARGDRDKGLDRGCRCRRRGGSGPDSGGRRVHHTVDESDHLVGTRCVAQRLDELLTHQGASEAGQQLHVFSAAGLGGGDQERQIGGPVGSAEVDGRSQAREPDRGGVDVGGAAVRDCDTAGQTGGRLLLARHGGGDEPVGIGGASGIGEPADESADHGLLVALDVHVEEHQIGVDDRLRGGACHGDTFVLVVTR